MLSHSSMLAAQCVSYIGHILCPDRVFQYYYIFASHRFGRTPKLTFSMTLRTEDGRYCNCDRQYYRKYPFDIPIHDMCCVSILTKRLVERAGCFALSMRNCPLA